MDGTKRLSRRYIVPRWRSIARTPTHELISTRQKLLRPNSDVDERIVSARARWLRTGSLDDAVDLHDLALVSSNDKVRRELAAWILCRSDSYNSATLRAVGRMNRVEAAGESQATSDIYSALSRLKARMIDAPRDAITASELARLYTIIGQREKAGRWITRAVALSPNNRYVLRCSAQFFSHVGDPSSGLDLIWKSDAVKGDSWVQAAEVALADAAGKTPRWALRQRAALLSGIENISLSELAIGVGSYEQKEGSAQRRVRKYMASSMRRPTENAVAQVAWMQAQGVGVVEERGSIKIEDFAAEARSIIAFECGDYSGSVSQALLWIADEPYSVPAFQMAGMCYNNFLDRPDLAKSCYESAFKLDPNAPMVINGLLVASAYNGDLVEAKSLLAKLEIFRTETEVLPYVSAAKGLLAFMEHDIEGGRKAYQDAVESSRGRPFLVANALMYWAEQEVMTGQADHSDWIQLSQMLTERFSGVKGAAGKDIRRTWAGRRPIIERRVRATSPDGEPLYRRWSTLENMSSRITFAE